MLVLSLFPGIGLLDMAFEQEGFTIVRGPDLLWGGDIKTFRPPAGVFDGVIGGPPCQMFSRLAVMIRANGHQTKFGNLIPEFERCVAEARPEWFLMENVPGAPEPVVDGYEVNRQTINNRWFTDGDTGAEQRRLRAVSFGARFLRGRNLAFDEGWITARGIRVAATEVSIGDQPPLKCSLTISESFCHNEKSNTGRIEGSSRPGR